MIRALFPATFDPIHNGHIDIANRASKFFDEVVVAVYDRPIKSLLFSPEERMTLVNETFKDHKNIRVTGFGGLTVDFCKEIDAQVIVRGLRVFSDFEYEFRLALANRELAPEIETVALITSKEHTFLSSTTVREIALLDGDVSSMVPENVVIALRKKYLEGNHEEMANRT
ncbi:MAG: pantetheine-phosphate adenylyltransferase [Chloroflexi bacterium]|jgi:pantetheine-phosphate adenylyltransferase|nr:pantetheine-phosphate adenylyltransferase [Chloroflexota bacterium]MBT3670713.1 pantetheine-phosphate adenylyltransferase [Chloroflexota bacterium]MBT4003992.1 pantetheine-phosphate adenylyltransferase [Chloroflexota bacterium]MBT4306251.1 pantetheine-phosphate adenylyltransferase [Chloroflexota bacterium]MBT4532868.1 pantetheine-phosphate adenylyltransferase [Chloroflexota bacterium]